jgi:hypothetical protein
MQINTAKRIVIEDYPAASRDVVQILAQTLNPFIDQISTALTNNGTVADNLKAQKTVQSLQAGISQFSFHWKLNERPSDLHIAQLSRPDASVPTAVFSLYWVYANGTITCNILGLDGSKAHVVTLVGQV